MTTSWTRGTSGERMRAAERAMREAQLGLERLAVEVEAQRVGRGDERAEAARRGELGTDWQRIQERIDGGRTNLADVFGGQDTSAEAERLRGNARARLDEAAKDAEENPDGRAGRMLAGAAEIQERLGALLRGEPISSPPSWEAPDASGRSGTDAWSGSGPATPGS